MQLKLGTKLYEKFTNVPLPLIVKVYLFNITNKDQVLAGLERPKFQEVGPFMYQEWRKRHVVDFEDNNRKIRFRESKTYYSLYDNSKSQDESDSSQMLNPSETNVTIINVPLLAVLTKLAQLEDGTLKKTLAARVAQRLVNDGRDKILVTRPANEILFDGYKVDFMEAARELFDSLGFNFESPLPGNRFGFFFMKNGTWNKNEAGELLVFTGRHGSAPDYPRIDSWNDMKMLKVWPNNTEARNRCNFINGTDGSQFKPGVKRHQTLHIFSPLVCTSIYVKYKEDTKVRGIPALRFVTPPDVFAAPKKNPRNACYCTITQPAIPLTYDQISPSSPPINDTRCYLDGLLDLSLCQRGAPIAASAPHFFNADPMLALASGLSPDKSRHETFLDIEPMTGSVIRAASRAQINAFVEEAALQVIDGSVVGRMTPMVAPLFWLEESGGVDEKIANELKTRLLNLVQKVQRTCIALVIIGLIIILVVTLHCWFVTCRSDDVDLVKTRAKKDRKREGRSGFLQRNLTSNFSKGARDSNLDQMISSSMIDFSEEHGRPISTELKGPIDSDTPDSDKQRLVDHEDDASRQPGESSRLKDTWDEDEQDPQNATRGIL